MTQTWWLSFSDPDLPKGQQFLGVAIVDITEEDAAAVHDDVDMTPGGLQRAAGDTSLDWLAAAVRESHLMGCNPGGCVLSGRIDDAPGFLERDARIPRNRLLSKADLETLDIL